MPDLLLELFSEEIPARMQARAAADLQKLMTDGMVEAGLTYADAAAFVTPRRLTLSVTGLPRQTAPKREERKGPRLDAPEKAVAGFLRATGLRKDQLEARDDKKGRVWFAVMEKPGRAAAGVIAEVAADVIQRFPWPKSMRWGAGSLRWVRPLHSILAILHDETGADVVPVQVDGIAAGDSTRGHRFVAPARFSVTSFEDYAAKLRKAFVMLDPAERADHIQADAESLAFAQGLDVVADKGLLAEVAGLVEWPVVLMGSIGAEFLDLPPEVLQTSMREHQKFFSVRNPKTGRIEKFITVANRETTDNGASILAGNARVLSARLADARFFWENDLRTPLEEMAAKLTHVTFHNKLGTQAERIERIASLAREIAPLVGADADKAEQAARIAKADLASEMVSEFPELQGVMGRYYAQTAGLPQEVANACEQHYSPLGPSDDVPREPVSVAVALADKIDTLTGFWAIDEKPTGSKDPFALRRAALGVIRLVLNNNTRIRLSDCVERQLFYGLESIAKQGWLCTRRKGSGHFKSDGKDERTAPVDFLQCFVMVDKELLFWHKDSAKELIKAVNNDNIYISGERFLHSIIREYDGSAKVPPIMELGADLLTFFHDRLKVHLRSEGIRHDVIDACLALDGQDDLVLLVNRVKALQAFLQTDDGANLLIGYKRANNILNAEEKKDGVAYEGEPEAKFAEQDEERALFAALDAAEPKIATALETEDFAAAMRAMAALRAPIDTFFDEVTVNADNAIIRRNRLCLLNRVRATMNRVARLSELDG